MPRGPRIRVEPFVVFMMVLAMVLGFIVILVGAWEVPTPSETVQVQLDRDILNGLEAPSPE